ncbi:MAG: type I restriction enzyme HsdR N-terminal domain-containing protein [Oscillospiraceae bacterium]|nr:type I restriction enzyme HsdR N-terminal domain-containing protein [Oscillospiraceae bacterium]
MEEFILNEKAFETSIIENLKKCGYPQESIIAEYPISKNYRADIVVVDTKTQIPVMLIEVKVLHHIDKTVEFRLYEQLKKYYGEFNTPLKAIGAIFNKQDGKVRYTDYTDAIKEHHYEQKVDNYSLPTYKELINGANQKVIKQKEIKQENNINILKRLCWYILPPICILILLLDAFGVYTLSTHRLILMGIGIALPLVPCFKEISIGEVSLKREIEKQSEEESK